MNIVSSSLTFVNDFLRSMIDYHSSMDNKIKVENEAKTDLLKDVVEPVHAILHNRNAIVRTDSLRLKQVVLNIVRNASKFVERGFICMGRGCRGSDLRVCVGFYAPGFFLPFFTCSRDSFIGNVFSRLSRNPEAMQGT